MKILYAASEAQPFIASGGLADVAGSLPKALRSRQQACRLVLPLYSGIKAEYRDKMKYVTHFYLPLAWRNQYCGLFETNVDGVKCYLLDNEYYFKRENLYGYDDDAERFAFFSKAVLELLNYIDFTPDIIHCNDWQTAMIPVYLKEVYGGSERHRSIKTVLTIHNIQYQGKYGVHLLGDVLGLSEAQGRVLEYDGCLNMMKGGIEHCDWVTTVSPTYARELLDPWYSHGLDRLLSQRQHKLSGILNGIDTVSYNPETDPALFAKYSLANLRDKQANKAGLCELMGLEQKADHALLGIVTRFVSHKGVDLIEHVFHEMMQRKLSVVVLGSGDYEYEQFFKAMEAAYPGRVAVRLGFLPDLARKIYAGSDLFLMPSKSEPCGLAQMIALRYGTIPIVRRTGGLADSIADMGGEGGNGFVFDTYNAHDMLGAIERACELYAQPEGWQAAVANAMRNDFSWGRSAGEYIGMYQKVLQGAD